MPRFIACSILCRCSWQYNAALLLRRHSTAKPNSKPSRAFTIDMVSLKFLQHHKHYYSKKYKYCEFCFRIALSSNSVRQQWWHEHLCLYIYRFWALMPVYIMFSWPDQTRPDRFSPFLIVSHHFSLFLIVSNRFSSLLTVSHCSSLFNTVSHPFSLFLTISHCFSPFLLKVPFSFSPFLIVSHRFSSFLTIFHCFS